PLTREPATSAALAERRNALFLAHGAELRRAFGAAKRDQRLSKCEGVVDVICLNDQYHAQRLGLVITNSRTSTSAARNRAAVRHHPGTTPLQVVYLGTSTVWVTTTVSGLTDASTSREMAAVSHGLPVGTRRMRTTWRSFSTITVSVE